MTTATMAEPAFISLTAASARTGLSTASLRRAIRAGRLQAYRPNRRVLLDPAELDAFVRGARRAKRK